MRQMQKQFAYIAALVLANMKSYGPEKKRLFIMSFFMVVQNSMFFVLWIIFFSNVKNLEGWQLRDIARMFGFLAESVGLSLFFCNGARTIAYRIQDGSLDSYITRPRGELLPILFSASSPASLADILYGPLIWFALGDVTWGDVPMLMAGSLLAALIVTAMLVSIYSIAFWLKGSSRLSEALVEMMLVSSNMIHGQPFFVKFVLFTVFPTAFITHVPTVLLQSFDVQIFGVFVVATIGYIWIAMRLFKAGLRRYVNAQT